MKTEFGSWINSRLSISVLGIVGIGATLIVGLINPDTLGRESHRITLLINLFFALFVFFTTSNRVPKLDKKKEITNEEIIFFRNTALDKIPKDFDFTKDFNPKENEIKDSYRRVHIVKRQFSKYWSIAWLSFAFVYAFKIFEPDLEIPESLKHFFNNSLNNIGTSFFILLFLTLNKRTINFKFHDWLKYFIWLFIIMIIELYYIYEIEGENQILFSILSGVFSAVVLCSFIGSLDSKYINFPYWLIIVLYTYGASQTLYFLSEYDMRFEIFEDQNNSTSTNSYISAILFFIFFIFKYFLYLAGSYLLTTKRLDYFIIEESALNFKRMGEVHYNSYKKLYND